MMPNEDPRFGEKVMEMAISILNAWPDDHNFPVPQAPARRLNELLHEMSAKMATYILYFWSAEETADVALQKFRKLTAIDVQYIKALAIINSQREEIEHLKARPT